jgi:hypothetical protein
LLTLFFAARWSSRPTDTPASTFFGRPSACMEAEQLGRLRDILEAARLISSYVAGRRGR